MSIRNWRPRLFVAALVAALAACGGGGGGGEVLPDTETKAVTSGFTGDLAWENANGLNNEGIGGGADGGGGFGVGGALGQFRRALVKVFLQDGTLLGEALTDDIAGMVTVRPPAGYQGPMLFEIRGSDEATYFEEGRNAYLPFGPERLLRAMIPRIDRNVGITPFSEAGARLALACRDGAAPGATCGSDNGGGAANVPGAGAINAGNGFVRETLNQQFPSALHVDDVTRLPFIVSDSTPAGAIATDQRGRYGLVNIAFSKQAAMYNDGNAAPTLAATDELANDLLDGRLDGRRDGQPVAPASQTTYDPHSWGSELSSALAQQTGRYGDSAAAASLPTVVAFGNVRYDSYFFDARVRADGDAATVAVATESNSTRRTPGQVTTYVDPAAGDRGFMVYGNMGSGGLFIKTDDGNSASKALVLGDNANGELGTGVVGDVEQPQALSLPAALTHAVGGFGHTTLRLADGSVYTVGDNAYGQLGQGRLAPDLPSSRTPVRVPLPAGAVAVAATYAASFALLENGQVWAWGGSIGFGELGNGQGSGIQASPQPVLDEAGNPLSNIVQISARDNDAIVLRADGTVLTWGSFTQNDRGKVPFGIAPGYARATPVRGLPAGAQVRKVLTEEGLFAALLHGGDQHGAVYTWGVYFDITAQDYLYDLDPVRVLNAPPLRDIMPGGFLGYGQQPSARTTGMGVDYRGRYWKLRGRVAERYDPADPTRQRRPQAQAPRTDCASCHTIRTETDPALAPADAPVCVLPAFKLDANGQPLLVNSASDCGSCHNGGSLSDGRVLAPLTCRAPSLPPPPAPTNATPKTDQCQLPIGHPDTPAGTFCASCHNQVITQPLSCSADSTPVPPPSATTVTIVSATDDVGPLTGDLSSGSPTDDSQPTLLGSTSAPLIAGESVRILQNGVDIGAASVDGGGRAWSFTLPTLTDGAYSFTARVLNAGGASGQQSAPFTLTIATLGPQKAVTITSIGDDIAPQTGAVAAGGSLNDPTPTLTGSITPAAAAGEVIKVSRSIAGGGFAEIGSVAPQGTSWAFTDAGLDAATGGNAQVAYTARLDSVTGAKGGESTAYAVRFDNQAPAAPTLSATADAPNSTIAALRAKITGDLVPGRGTSDGSPTIIATLASGDPGDRIEFTMSSASSGRNLGPVDSTDAGGGRRNASTPIATGVDLNGTTAGFGGSARTFFARAIDAAGNVGPLSDGFPLTVGFFGCETLRSAINHVSSTSNCAGCHQVGGPNRTRLLVPPSGNGQYWCTTDTGEQVATPR
ncbi:MAG: Ig-like domain-containing protein [Burkholderiaceae bacterium]